MKWLWSVCAVAIAGLVGCGFPRLAQLASDAAPDAVPDAASDTSSHVQLTWLIADVLSSGAPDPGLIDVPIDPAPAVRYAEMDGAWSNTSYSPHDGSIVVDPAFFRSDLEDGSLRMWRLEYDLPGDPPHEVQWAPRAGSGRLSVPLFGRVARNPVPAGGGYIVTPAGAPSNFQSPHVFTTGQWSEGLVPGYNGTGSMIDYDFVNAAAMSGARARPEPALGDRAFLTDYAVDGTGCRYAIGSARLDSAAIVPNQHTQTTAIWDARTSRVTSETVSFVTQSRFLTALGALHSSPNPRATLWGTISLGIAANNAMPPLTGVSPSPMVPMLSMLPAPVMITLLQCPFDVATMPDTAQPSGLDNFPRLLNVQLVSTREVLGVSLASGIETAIASPTSENFKLIFPAAIPTKITLSTSSTVAFPIDGDNEQVNIGPVGNRVTLTFAPDEMDASADYYDVTLYQLAAGALVPQRIYTTTEPQVALDGALIQPEATYVLKIRSFKGHPSAASGDFRAVSFPYGSAIVFSRTFHAS